MKKRNLEIEPYRIMDYPDPDVAAACVGSNNGAFRVPGGLRVIASDGEGWDHVSVSLPDRCPTWEEMKGNYILDSRPVKPPKSAGDRPVEKHPAKQRGFSPSAPSVVDRPTCTLRYHDLRTGKRQCRRRVRR
jgi:hypothetical protein